MTLSKGKILSLKAGIDARLWSFTPVFDIFKHQQPFIGVVYYGGGGHCLRPLF
jgi:hypothetical protein